MLCDKLALIELLKLRYPGLEKKELFARILCGEVLVDGEKIKEPKTLISKESTILFHREKKYVSRGGEKLEAVLNAWQVEVKNLRFIDAGASTGGFTDCLLKRGARQVYAVDVGYNRLDYRLRKDERVVVFERTNILSVNRKMFAPGALPDAAVADLSFRSIRSVASHLLKIVSQGWLIALVKPQFEWTEPDRSFRGIVDDRAHHYAILSHLIEELWQETAYVAKLAISPIRGRKGNIEFFYYLTREECAARRDILMKLADLMI